MKIKLAGVDVAVTQIRREYEAFVEAGRNATQHAWRLGELLVQKKESLPHGEWLPWLNENVDFAERTARRFMGFYEEVRSNRTVLSDLPADAYAQFLPKQAPRVTLKPLPAPADHDEDEVEVEVVERKEPGRPRKPPTFEHEAEYWQTQLGITEDSVASTLEWGKAWTTEQRKELWTRIIKPMIRELDKLSKWGR